MPNDAYRSTGIAIKAGEIKRGMKNVHFQILTGQKCRRHRACQSMAAENVKTEIPAGIRNGNNCRFTDDFLMKLCIITRDSSMLPTT